MPISRTLLLCAVALLGICPGCSSVDEPEPAAGNSDRERVRNFWISFREANRLRVEGRFAEAAEAYLECRRQNPEHEETLFYLGVTLQQCGRYPEAVEAYGQLLDLNPRSGRSLSQLASLLATPAPGAPANHQRAEELLRQLLEINREQTGPFLQLGWLALNRGDREAASRNFLLAAESGSPEGFAWAGFTALLQGREEKAATLLKRPVEMQRRERGLAGAGVRSEGDVLPTPNKPLGALDRAALISKFLLQPPEEAPRRSGPVFAPIDGAPTLSRAGSGAWGDFDGDHRPDLAVAGGRLALFRNLGGSFSDITDAAGLSGVTQFNQLYWVDYDGDGLLDLYLAGERPARIYRNLGNGRFEDATAAAGLAHGHPASHAIFVDLDGDNRPELVEAGRPARDTRPLRLYDNSEGRYVLQDTTAWALTGTVTSIAAADFDADGRPDLAILSWRQGLRILMNRSGGWVKLDVSGIAANALGLTAFDYDRDGLTDLLVTAHAPWEDALRSLFQLDFSRPESQPRLLRNTGEGHFEDVTAAVGLGRGYGTMRALAADFDGDQWTDLLFLNGSVDALRLESSILFRNEAGKRFTVWSRIPGDGSPANLVSGAVADIDGDGDPDLYLAANPLLPPTSAAGILRNTLR